MQLSPYIDSSVIIDFLYVTSPRHLAVKHAIDSVSAFSTSDLVQMECSVGALRNTDITSLARLDQVLSRGDWLPITQDVYRLAAQLRADHRALRTPDALHLACAIHHGADELWTYDVRFLTVSSKIPVVEPH